MDAHNGATVIVIKPSGKILMQLRDDGKGKKIPYPDMWNFPGGAMELGESYIDTAVREMREEFELDIQPSSLKLLCTYHHDQTLSDHVLACKVVDGIKLVLHEGADMQWFTLEQVKNLQLGFDQVKVIPYIESYLRGEGFCLSRMSQEKKL